VAYGSCHALIGEYERKRLHQVLVWYRNFRQNSLSAVTPFILTGYNFPEAKDIMIYSPSTTGLRPEEIQWNRLFEDSDLLPFQTEGQTLMDTYVANAASLPVDERRELTQSMLLG
jgi:hypothetical protein